MDEAKIETTLAAVKGMPDDDAAWFFTNQLMMMSEVAFTENDSLTPELRAQARWAVYELVDRALGTAPEAWNKCVAYLESEWGKPPEDRDIYTITEVIEGISAITARVFKILYKPT